MTNVPSKRTAGRKGGLALLRRLRALRGAGALVGAMALLVQVWLPFVHHPVLTAAADPQSYARTAAFFGDEVALCSAQGAPTSDQSGVPGKLPSHRLQPCPICQTLHLLGSVVPPTAGFVVAGPPPAVPAGAIGQATIVAHVLDPTAQPRAPPAMA